MAFPGPGAQVYYNEAGEPLGWDYPSDEPYELDPYEESREAAESEQVWEAAFEIGEDRGWTDRECEQFAEWLWPRRKQFTEIQSAADQYACSSTRYRTGGTSMAWTCPICLWTTHGKNHEHVCAKRRGE